MLAHLQLALNADSKDLALLKESVMDCIVTNEDIFQQCPCGDDSRSKSKDTRWDADKRLKDGGKYTFTVYDCR